MPPSANTIKTGSQIASELSQEIHGKIILTTGVSPGGLGAEFVKTISKHKAKLLILAGRNSTKLEETQTNLGDEVNTQILVLDLSSQEQIRKAAEQVLQYNETIDIIVNNAGIMATPFQKTKDDIELQFGCNHIGHFLFTNLIMSKLSNNGRIINISSDGFRLGPVRFKDVNFQNGAEYNRWRAYGQSKTANMLFSKGLAKRLNSKSKSKSILSFSIHPGVIQTQLSSQLEMSAFEELSKLDKMDGHNISDLEGFTFLNLDQGIANHIYAAFHPDLQSNHNGDYLEECRGLPPQEVLSWARDEVEADLLWELSEKLVGQSFSF